MGKLVKNGIAYCGASDHAANIKYNNNLSNLDATTVQEAIDKLEEIKIDADDVVNNLTTDDATKPLSAKQGKVLQDNKMEKTEIVDNLTTEDATKVLSARQGKILQDNKAEQANLTVNDIPFVFDYQNGKYGYNESTGREAATFHPFRQPHTGTYAATARQSDLDMGEEHEYRFVDTTSVPNSNSETYSATSKSSIDLGETNKVRYLNTTTVPNTNSGTYNATVRSSQIDMGETNGYRYVSTSSVPNANSATYSATSRNSGLDMGSTNTYRYVNTNNVPNTNSGTFTPSSNSSGHDMGATNTYRYVNTNTVYNLGYNSGYSAGQSALKMKVLNYGVISSSTTITLSESCSVSNYIVILNTNGYYTDYTGTFTKTVAYGYGIGAYVSSKSSTTVTITVSSGITCSYEIIKVT